MTTFRQKCKISQARYHEAISELGLPIDSFMYECERNYNIMMECILMERSDSTLEEEREI